ncbi:MAG: transcriptional regulator [Flavobacteriales bacterium]|jgi:DNA-binding MarR family transcriptional regulator|nr:transcriptional regulator [Flavobacteriales bacterium]MDF1674596.1 transcriptional regulator [Vicingaceae bacterium]MBQ19419.1 transcriptional regulator [Flavobacteriales bacterium]MCW8898846.1 transcriptional regulator [Flavobacteriales bacterium]MCW8913130.1 transcriptional regulator [Flavobacteriales bacterium]|tara:strand:- start:121934 stop:122224 length:291 start_codon:yes stop_codon:yes gene_type:complete
MIEGLNKIFESRVRLGIMSVLMVNDEIDFNSLKELLNVTDGNLASHIAGLEKNEYIKVMKEFVGKKPKTSFAATLAGKKAFQDHLTALENLLNQHN